MGVNSKIGWTDNTWSPLRVLVREDAAKIAEEKGYRSLIQIAEKNAGHIGHHCEKVSEECDQCYSMHMQARCLPYNGTGLPFDRRSRDLVEPFVDQKELLKPLTWRESKKIFVENQSDLFGDWYADEMIDQVFSVAALCPQHTFQILTKRPERMLKWFDPGFDNREHAVGSAMRAIRPKDPGLPEWPLPNVWLGVSAGTQKAADERLPVLEKVPASVRFVSYEPALESVNFRPYLGWLDWVIVGGESQKGARAFFAEWAMGTVLDCDEFGKACFVKQFGARPYIMNHSLKDGSGAEFIEFASHVDVVDVGNGRSRIHLKDGKHGADPTEWPTGLQVQEFPTVTSLAG